MKNSNSMYFSEKYRFDSRKNVYISKEREAGIGYADGGEHYLMQVVESGVDLSTASNDAVKHMKDWPSEYHLSQKRHLILEPLNIQPGQTVLELGCGCGALTRYLGEIGALVTAVEGEVSRAQVAAARTKDLPNVTVVVDDLLEIDFQEKFDWVLLIGVFEYSQKYGKTGDRQEDYLKIVKNHLKPSGTLAIAIENKIGVKYITGAGEDHNSKLHYGIQDLYADDDITTWGKGELSSILNKSGFDSLNFYGVFPDYKLPKVIFSEKINEYSQFRAEELLLYVKSHDYTGKALRYFDDSLFCASLRKNKLLVEMANSFLVLAKFEDEVLKSNNSESDILAFYFSVDRINAFRTKTTFQYNNLNYIVVEKSGGGGSFSVVDSDGKVFEIKHKKNDQITEYLDGELLASNFSKSIVRGSIHQVNEILKTWMDFLLSRFSIYDKTTGRKIEVNHLQGLDLSSVMIDGDALDCGPHNLIIHEGKLTDFDLEWIVGSPIPLSWVLKRSVDHILRFGYPQEQVIASNDVVGLICQNIGLTARLSDIEEASNFESKFQASVGLSSPTSSWGLRKVQNI